MTILLITLYLIGIPVGYLAFKKYWTMDGDEWTVGSRRFGFVTSVLSWANLLPLVFFLFIHFKCNSDKPASW